MDNKLSEIEDLAKSPSMKNVSRLLELSYDTDEEVRFRSIEAFVGYTPTSTMLERIRKGVFDSDELVRTTCIELIGDWQDCDSLELLYSALSDDIEIVRSAAITSLGQLGQQDTVRILEEKFSKLEGTEKASAVMALYSLGKQEYFDELLALFDDNNYITRCAAANLICRFVRNEDKGKAIRKMRNALLQEETKAASSSIANAIRLLESQKNRW